MDLNYKLDIPWKLISLLGWMIWPRNGKNTNGIFSDDDPLTNGANVHSVTRKKKNPNGRETSDFYWISTFTISKIHAFFSFLRTNFSTYISIYCEYLNEFMCVFMQFHVCVRDDLIYCHTWNEQKKQKLKTNN